MREVALSIREYAQHLQAASDVLRDAGLPYVEVRIHEGPWIATSGCEEPDGITSVYMFVTRREAWCHFEPWARGLINRACQPRPPFELTRLSHSIHAICTDGLLVVRDEAPTLVRFDRFVPCMDIGLAEAVRLYTSIARFEPSALGLHRRWYARVHKRPVKGIRRWFEAKSHLATLWSMQGNTLAWAVTHSDPTSAVEQWIQEAGVSCTAKALLDGSAPRPY